MDIRMIAHDMRAPLSALSFAIENARRSPSSEGRLRSLEIAARNAAALSRILDSIVDAGVSGVARLHIAPCRPSELIDHALDQVTLLAEQKSLRIENGVADDLPLISVDGTRITRVLVNLLTNAIRFSPDDSRIAIDCRLLCNDGHSVIVFSVRDEGPGIPPEDIQRVFVAGVSIGQSSSGLGLAVCKEIVEAHGGRIWIETDHPAGASVSFSISCETVPAGKVPADSIAPVS